MRNLTKRSVKLRLPSNDMFNYSNCSSEVEKFCIRRRLMNLSPANVAFKQDCALKGHRSRIFAKLTQQAGRYQRQLLSLSLGLKAGMGV
jgi:hypothetical protein